MDYRKIIIAHRAFYEIETRARYYDQYLKSKVIESWNQPDLPMEEIEKLFLFIIHWDYHFKGDREAFRSFYYDNFDKFKQLEKVSLLDLDLEDRVTMNLIRDVFTGVANCSYGGRFESTDASKILQTINPKLFVMWDMRIRKGILGSDSKYGAHYVGKFLPKMKQRLNNIIEFTIKEKGCSPIEAINSIESYCDGKTMAKLLDEYNYMVFTMRTEFSAYLSGMGMNLSDFTSKENLKVKCQVQDKFGDYGSFIELLNEVRSRNLIEAAERRHLENEWRNNPDRRTLIEERLNFLKNKQ